MNLILPPLDGHAAEDATLHLLHGLVLLLRPALIVEAGTYKGHAACVMGKALRDSQTDGEVWTADVTDHGAQECVTRNGLGRWVHCYHGDFGDMLATLAGRTWRLAFIDSGPTFEVEAPQNIRTTHAQAAYDGLGPEGMMVIDDVWGEWIGVETWRARGFVIPGGRGVALVGR